MKVLSDILLCKGAGLILDYAGDQASLRIDPTSVALITPTARDFVVSPEGVERFRVKNTAAGVVVSAHVVPVANNTHDLGSTSFRYRAVYAVDGNYSGTMTIGTIANDSASNAFLTSASGVVKYRNAAQVLSDIGGMSATGSFYLGTTLIALNRSSAAQSLSGINIDGNAGTATALATGRTISITGDLSYTSPSFDGSGNVTAAGTLASIITAGGPTGSASVVPVITWDAKGRLTTVTTATIVAGSTVAVLTMNNGGAGDVSGSTFNGSTAKTISYNTIGAPSATGSGASGTWGISITGTAASETLATVAGRGNQYNGNIGLGAATNTWAAGWYVLNLYNSAFIAGRSGTTDVWLISNAYYDGANWKVTGSASHKPSAVELYDGTFNFLTGTTAAIGSNSTFTSVFAINSSGAITSGIWNGAAIANAYLANSTISGISLGSNLATLTFGSYITGTSYNGSTAVTIGLSAGSSNVAGNLVARDVSGNFVATNITATLIGNASTATALQTARTINGVSFDGTANITITAATPNALTAGTDLSGGSYNGSSAVTFNNTSTLATVTGRGATTSTATTFSGGISVGTALNITVTGQNGYQIGANGTANGFYIYNTSDARYDFYINDVSGAATFVNSVTASNFIGPGTGLTGTAGSLSIGGNAATATLAANSTLWGGVAYGGPYLPLAAGSGSPLSGDLYLRSGSTPYATSGRTILTMPSGANGSLIDMQYNGSTLGYIHAATSFDFNATSAVSMRFSTNAVTRYTIDASGYNTWTGSGFMQGDIRWGGQLYTQQDGSNSIQGKFTLYNSAGSSGFNWQLNSGSSEMHLYSLTSGTWSNVIQITKAGGATFGGSVSISGSSGQALVVNGINNQWTTNIVGGATTGQSYGLLVTAGTNGSDNAMYVQNRGGSSVLFTILGNGNTSVATGTLNVAGRTTSPGFQTSGSNHNYFEQGLLRIAATADDLTLLDITTTTSGTFINSNYYSGGSYQPLIISANPAAFANQLRLSTNGGVAIGSSSPYQYYYGGGQNPGLRIGGFTNIWNLSNASTYFGNNFFYDNGWAVVNTGIGNLMEMNYGSGNITFYYTASVSGGSTTSPISMLNLDGANSGDATFSRNVTIGNTFSAGGNGWFSGKDFGVGITSSLQGTTGRGSVSINGSSSAIVSLGVGGVVKSYYFTDGSNTYFANTTGGNTYITSGSDITALTLASNQAATFASTVLANGSITVQGNATGLIVRSGSYSMGHIGGAVSASDFAYAAAAGDFVISRNVTAGYSNTNLILANQNSGGIYFSFGTGNNDTVKGYFDSAGNFYAQSLTPLSDMRLKDVIRMDVSPIIGIEKLKPHLYKKSGRTELGYFAQEAQNIIPYAVHETHGGYLGLSYNDVFAAKIDRLETVEEKQEKRIAQLEKQIIALGGTITE